MSYMYNVVRKHADEQTQGRCTVQPSEGQIPNDRLQSDLDLDLQTFGSVEII